WLARPGPGPAVVAQEEAAEFVGSPDDEGEGRDGGELGAGERRGAEDAVQGRYVDQRGGERQRDGDGAEQEPVREHAYRMQRCVVGADRECGADLASDDAEPGDGGGLPVGVIEGAAGSGGGAGMPSAVAEGEVEAGHDEGGGDEAEESPRAGQHPAADDALAAGPR